MKNIIERAKFNRTGDLSLLDTLGLPNKFLKVINNFIQTGEAPESLYTKQDFSAEFKESASNLVEVISNKQTIQLVRIISFALKEANLVFVSGGKPTPLNEFFQAMYGIPEGELLDIIVSNEDLLGFINSFKLTIRQAKVKHPYVAAMTNIKNGETSLSGAGIVFSNKIDNLDSNTKNWIKVAAFMDACIGITLGPSTSMESLVELLDSNMAADFSSDKLYTQLILVSLERGVTINDIYADLEVQVTDYEEIYNSLGKVILVTKKGEYVYQGEDDVVVKIKGEEILNHIDF